MNIVSIIISLAFSKLSLSTLDIEMLLAHPLASSKKDSIETLSARKLISFPIFKNKVY